MSTSCSYVATRCCRSLRVGDQQRAGHSPRRIGSMMRALGFLLIGLLSGSSQAVSGDHGDALSRLLAGNHRYVTGTAAHPNQTAGRRRGVAGIQHPFAIILGCSDSRVPPEVVFDQGLGDLFVIRVAGNIADPAALGSIEYAAEHLGV